MFLWQDLYWADQEVHLEKRLYRKTPMTFLANSINKLVLFSMYIQALFTDRELKFPHLLFFNEILKTEEQ